MAKSPKDFNARLPLATFDSWWELGKTAGDAAEADERQRKEIFAARAAAATASIRAEFPKSPPVKSGPLREFVETVVDLLERKSAGEKIADRVQGLVVGGRTSVREEPDHLVIVEDEAEFWGTEYALLFGELTPGRERDDWRHAIAYCADPQCGRFFIKRRANQEFHSERCRWNVANRQRRPKKPHGGGGKR